MTVLTRLRAFIQRISPLPSQWYRENPAVCLFFLMSFIAVFTFTGYGVGVDEFHQRILGLLTLVYILDPAYKEDYLSYHDVDYPVFFELILAGAELFYAVTVSIFEYSGGTFSEWKTHLIETVYNAYISDWNYHSDNDSTYFRHIILIRHFITHSFFLLSALFACKLVYFLYKNKTLAVIAFFLVVLHPRLYAHSFFNSKDIPFLSMFIISLYYTAVALKHKTSKNFIILGVCIGILTNIRIMGIMLPCMVIFFLALDMLKEKQYLFYAKQTGILLVVFCMTLYISWPYLWSAPVENFITAFENMRQFRNTTPVLFNGKIYISDNLPGSYIPVWFSITTPVIYLLFGFFGIAIISFRFLKQPINLLYNPQQRFFLICCGVFLAPVILVILFNSVLYANWQHVYFIYAGFVFLAIYGIDFLSQKSKKIIYIPFVAFIFCAVYMVRAYPLQQTYFNALVPKNNEYISENFAIGYWVTSSKDALEYILKVDNSPVIKVSAILYHTKKGILHNRQFLKPDSARVVIIDDIYEADYAIIYNIYSNTKPDFVSVFEAVLLNPVLSNINAGTYSNTEIDFAGIPIHTIKRQNNTIATIYKLKNR